MQMRYAEWLDLPEPAFFQCYLSDSPNPQLLAGMGGELTEYLHRVAVLRVGEALYKFDGVAKKTAWENGSLPIPINLTVDIIEISPEYFEKLVERAEASLANTLYANIAIRQSYERLGIHFNSKRLSQGFIKEPLDIASSGIMRRRHYNKRVLTTKEPDFDIDEMIRHFENELHRLDKIDPDPELFNSGVIAAALLMFALDKPVELFLYRFNRQQGVIQDNGRCDPVEALLRIVKEHNQLPIGHRSKAMVSMCQKALNAMEIWLAGETSSKYWRSRVISGIDHMHYVFAVQKAKGLFGRQMSQT